jgi:hypothetical protein
MPLISGAILTRSWSSNIARGKASRAAHGIGEQLDQITRKTWAKAIQSSFDTNPETCPDCGATLIESAVFSYFADREWRKL